jgi:hypothetical protein
MAKWYCGATACLLLLVVTAVVSYIVGGIRGQSQLYRDQANEQAVEMQNVLDQHKNKFSDVTIHEASNGWSYFVGTVKKQEDFDLLQSETQRIFGEQVGRKMMRSVSAIEPKQDAK